jgi:hypothetical protein
MFTRATNNFVTKTLGGALYLKTDDLHILNSNFFNTSALFGGSLYIDSGSIMIIIIEYCNFEGNYGSLTNSISSGGSIFISTENNLEFQANIKNNIFK